MVDVHPGIMGWDSSPVFLGSAAAKQRMWTFMITNVPLMYIWMYHNVSYIYNLCSFNFKGLWTMADETYWALSHACLAASSSPCDPVGHSALLMDDNMHHVRLRHAWVRPKIGDTSIRLPFKYADRSRPPKKPRASDVESGKASARYTTTQLSWLGFNHHP